MQELVSETINWILALALKQDINNISYFASGSWAGAWPLLTIAAIPWLISFAVIFKEPLNPEAYKASSVGFFLFFPWVVWIKLHRVKIESGTLHYRSGLGFSKQVDISKGFKAKSVSKTGGVWGCEVARLAEPTVR